MITYNHVEFIKDAIEGVINQQTEFPFELIIGDDASTDGTTDIILSYQKQYPHIIKVLTKQEFDKKNKNHAPFMDNLERTLRACKGRYIAFCEGDDYWTDPYKLQKQVDFLEQNPDFSICFHNAWIINQETNEKILSNNQDTPVISCIDDLLKGVNYITTASSMFRANITNQLPYWFNLVPFGDYALHLLSAQIGKIYYIDEVMSVYRIHAGSIHGSLTRTNKGLVKAYEQQLIFWKIVNKYSDIDKMKTRSLIILAIRNIIYYSRKSDQFNKYIYHNFLLLLYSRGWLLKEVLRNFRSLLKNA